MATKINTKPSILKQSQSGFTLIETMFVLVLVGILSAIAVPSYLGLLNRQRLNNAQEQVLTAMQTAQASAKREKRAWETCFRDDGTKVLWSAHNISESNASSCSNATNWEMLIGENSKTIAISTTNTNLDNSQAGYYRRQFEYDGSVNPPLGKITLIVRNQSTGIKRCIIVSTILGALRTDKDAGCI